MKKNIEELLKYGKCFKIKNLDEYHDLYLNTEVLLLCDVLKFLYGLDPCHYISSPGLSWDAMSKFTRVKLEKISDIDVHLLLEGGIRGGVSYV